MKYLLILLIFATASALAVESRPNILVMFSDDHGYADLACQGSPIKTTASQRSQL